MLKIVELAYSIRESVRAKHVSIKISLRGEVEIVVPKGFDQRRVPELLQRRQDWIAKTTERIATERQATPAEPTGALPDQIEWRSPPLTWTVAYLPSDAPNLSLTTQKASHQLILRGSTHHLEACRQALRQWLTRQSYFHLAPWLKRTSKEISLPYSRVSVRGQKTRWASCSSQKSISLNHKLLFLPPDLVRYVFIHELCHTVHLNHSAKFWALVEKKEPNYRALDAELNKAWRYIPAWVEQSFD
ncbi:M48 family metallopeptidase [Cyanobacteria bacterium FACHB-471]|nr:M48 family metallopeptidase [Cyanobacteria bacterium FACHB-471]